MVVRAVTGGWESGRQFLAVTWEWGGWWREEGPQTTTAAQHRTLTLAMCLWLHRVFTVAPLCALVDYPHNLGSHLEY